MHGRFPALRTSIGRIRSNPLLLGVGVVSVLATFLGLLASARVAGLPDSGTPVAYLVGIAGAMVVAAAARSVLLAPILAVAVPGMGRSGERSGATGGGGRTRRILTTARRARSAVLAVPVVYAAGIAVGVLALVPVLAAYGVAVTALQAAGWALAGDPVVSTGLVDAGLLFLVLPAAAAVGVGATGFAIPAVAGGRSPGAAVRAGFGRFVRRPRRRIGRGATVVALLFAPLAVLLAGGFLGATEGIPYWISVLAAVLVAVACYATGPVYRTVVAEPGAGIPADEYPTDPDRTTAGDPRRLTVRGVLAAVVLSAFVLGGVGAVRVADVGPTPGAPSPPGYDAGTDPTGTVAKGGSWLAAVDHETRVRHYRMDNGSDGEWRLERRRSFRFDAGDRRVGILSTRRNDVDRQFRGTMTYVTPSVVLRRHVDLTGDLQSVDPDLGPDWQVDGATTTGGSAWGVVPDAYGTGLFEDVEVGVPTATGFVEDLSTAEAGTFRRVASPSGRVVLETVDTAAYCRFRRTPCEDYSVVEARVRVVLDAETGVPVEATETRTRRRPNPDTDESSTVRIRREYRFETRDVEVTRPDVPRGVTELLFDALVY